MVMICECSLQPAKFKVLTLASTCVMDNGNEVELEREGADHTTGTATAPTSVTDCHTHGDDLFCTADGVEWEVTSDINVNNAPDSYSNCQASGDDDNDM